MSGNWYIQYIRMYEYPVRLEGLSHITSQCTFKRHLLINLRVLGLFCICPCVPWSASVCSHQSWTVYRDNWRGNLKQNWPTNGRLSNNVKHCVNRGANVCRVHVSVAQTQIDALLNNCCTPSSRCDCVLRNWCFWSLLRWCQGSVRISVHWRSDITPGIFSGWFR